ncbi:MAG: phytanoyl-CoA dioxygenase family protein [Bacteroidota bacterium]
MDQELAFYKKNRFIKLKSVFPQPVLDYFNEAISDQVAQFQKTLPPLAERDTYGKAFLQLMNLWVDNETIRQLVFSKRVAKLAADLMQVSGVRLYHDQALFKEAGGGFTPWHVDQHYWPLSSDRTITAWMPLQATPLAMGPLEFSVGSHQLKVGRELSIGEESERLLNKKLRITDFPHSIEPFEVGEISFHSGWIFHRAGANTTDQIRKVMTIIYMDEAMKLKAPENDHQRNDWESWCPGAEVGAVIDTPLNPVLYP